MLPGGRSRAECRAATPKIMEFLKEYKRIVEAERKTSPVSYVGETPDAAYKEQSCRHDSEYVSGVPAWITAIKEWKLCSGKHHTYYRRVRVPAEHKETVEKYMHHCSHCIYRAECQGPCLDPENMSQEKLFA